MSKVKIQGNASGTGVVTLTAPNTNTDRTITLPDGTQTLIGADASGNVTVSTGNLVIGTSGKGIDFSAVSDGTRSVSSNVLDDYETGTFTPTAVAGFTGFGVYSGEYTKVGDLVHISFYLNSLTGSSANRIEIGGLPFASKGGDTYFTSNADMGAKTTGLARVQSGTAAVIFFKNDSTRSAYLGTDAPTQIIVNVTYLAA
jgi:hypothetical protein